MGFAGPPPGRVIHAPGTSVLSWMLLQTPQAPAAAPQLYAPPAVRGRNAVPIVSARGASEDTERMTVLLVRLAAGHDREAFAELFGFYAPRLKAYMRRLGAEGTVAEDIAQEAMAAVWNKARLFDPTKANAGTWIFTIARNLRIDVLRRERRPEIDFNDPALLPDEPDSPEQIIADRRSATRVRTALAALPPDQARIIELSFFENHTHSTIAHELGMPLGTVKSRIRLAFQRFRRILEERP